MPPNVQFETDDQLRPKVGAGASSNKGGLIGWLVRSGLAKDEAGANKLLVAILIANLVLIFLVIKLFL